MLKLITVCFDDYLQDVLMAGMVRVVTVAVIVYLTLHVITLLESAPVMLDGRDLDATNVSYYSKLQLLSSI